jgi:hypothetical protein
MPFSNLGFRSNLPQGGGDSEAKAGAGAEKRGACDVISHAHKFRFASA